VMYTEWAAAALKLLVWGALVAADVDLPPPKYDHPYRGPVQYVYDFPVQYDGDFFWGYTVPPRRKGGPCLIHLSPIGSVVDNQVMTEEALRKLIRHEWAHCAGLLHSGDDGKQWVSASAGRPKTVPPRRHVPWPGRGWPSAW
jgi:hypothetical protein